MFFLRDSLKDVTGPGFYSSLRRNILLVIIAVSFAPLVLITGLIGYYFHTSYQNKVLDHLVELVEKHKQSIDAFLYERLSGIALIARTFDFEQLSNEMFLREKLSILREEYGGIFVDLGLVSDKGIQIAYAGPFELRRAMYSDAEWFKKAMQSQVFISDVFTGLRGMPHFIVAVKRTYGSREWLLRATIDFVAFNSLVESTKMGATGSAFILNRAGEFQTRPRTESAVQRERLLDFLSKRSLEERVAAFQQKDLSGRSFLYVLTPLKNGEWILVYQQDEDDAYADLYRARRWAFLIVLVGGLGIVATSVALSRRMVHRIERADREKEMMNEQVIEAGKLASVGELAAGIAHEINNPVAIMVEEAGWIEDLLEDEQLSGSANLEEFRRAVRQIQTQGRRCKEITHKLLSFARKTDPKLKEVQLNDLVQEMASLCEQRARFSNVRMELHLDPALPKVCASPSEMQQVFLNLINNALDAMEKTGGKIDITTRVEADRVVVDVADTGPGIPQANLGRIFDPFFTTKPVGKGTGLGLSICYGIIHKMGGEISVQSAVGMGTVFHIRLPLPKGEGKGSCV
jgi:two-component system NtrC family sensor kinase